MSVLKWSRKVKICSSLYHPTQAPCARVERAPWWGTCPRGPWRTRGRPISRPRNCGLRGHGRPDCCPSFCRDTVQRGSLGPDPSPTSVLSCFGICLSWWHSEGTDCGPFPASWQKDTSDHRAGTEAQTMDEEGSRKAGGLTWRRSSCLSGRCCCSMARPSFFLPLPSVPVLFLPICPLLARLSPLLLWTLNNSFSELSQTFWPPQARYLICLFVSS